MIKFIQALGAIAPSIVAGLILGNPVLTPLMVFSAVALVGLSIALILGVVLEFWGDR